MLDGSTSLQAEGFEKARGFVKSLVAYLDISPTAARVAVVQYSGPKKYFPKGDPKYEDYGKVETDLFFEEEDVGAPKVRGRRPTKVVAAGRLKGNIEFDGLKPKPEYHQLGDIVEKLPKTTYLAVQVNHAFGLMPADASGTSDPFVVVQWDGREQSTQVKYRTLSPKWGQTLYFPLKVMAVTKELLEKKPPVSIRCFDMDEAGHDLLGSCEIPLHKITSAEQ